MLQPKSLQTTVFESTQVPPSLVLHLEEEWFYFSIIDWTAKDDEAAGKKACGFSTASKKSFLIHYQDSLLLPDISMKEIWAKMYDELISSSFMQTA